MSDRFSEYRIMWILVFFDLPTETKRDKQAYALFRKNLNATVSLCFSSLFTYVIVPAWRMPKYILSVLSRFFPNMGMLVCCVLQTNSLAP